MSTKQHNSYFQHFLVEILQGVMQQGAAEALSC